MNAMTKTNRGWLPNILDDIFEERLTDSRFKNLSTLPAVNIQESEDRFTIELAAPGKAKEDFNIELDNDLLTISSEKKTEQTTADKAKNYTRKEFSYQSFKRSFTLPESIDVSAIKANYENGVLNVELPKREEAKTQPKRLIDIS
jgi:HSP20 family protein